MIRLFLFITILLTSTLTAAQQTAEVYETYLPAKNLIPILEPLLGEDDRITAYGNKLFVKASPAGKVPALVDQGTYLAEALDINVYLDHKYPQHPLLPREAAERETILQWIREMDKKLTIKIGLYIVECLLKPKERQKEAAKEKLPLFTPAES